MGDFTRIGRDVGVSQSTFWSEEHLASLSPSLDGGRDGTTRAATSPLNILPWLDAFAPAGGLGTSPASCRMTEDGRVGTVSGSWGNSGTGSPTAFLTLSSSEFHSAAVACSLSDILERGSVPQRYYLSPRACRGILRRAERRGKALPPALLTALTQVAEGATQDEGERTT